MIGGILLSQIQNTADSWVFIICRVYLTGSSERFHGWFLAFRLIADDNRILIIDIQCRTLDAQIVEHPPVDQATTHQTASVCRRYSCRGRHWMRLLTACSDLFSFMAGRLHWIKWLAVPIRATDSMAGKNASVGPVDGTSSFQQRHPLSLFCTRVPLLLGYK